MALRNDYQNRPKRTLFLGNLPNQIPTPEFNEMLRLAPGLKRAKCWRSDQQGRKRLNILIEFRTCLQASNAFSALHDYHFSTHRTYHGIQVSYAKRELNQRRPRRYPLRAPRPLFSALFHYLPTPVTVPTPLNPLAPVFTPSPSADEVASLADESEQDIRRSYFEVLGDLIEAIDEVANSIPDNTISEVSLLEICRNRDLWW